MFLLAMREFDFISVASAWFNVPASNCFSVDCVSQMIVVSSFVVMFQGVSMTSNDEVLQLIVCAFHSTSAFSASVSHCHSIKVICSGLRLSDDFCLHFYDVPRNLFDKQ